jgi:hypothetical protein
MMDRIMNNVIPPNKHSGAFTMFDTLRLFLHIICGIALSIVGFRYYDLLGGIMGLILGLTVLGLAVYMVITLYWLELTPDWTALLVGAVFSILGASLGENVGDAIMFSLIAGVIAAVFINFGPEIAIVKVGTIPVVTGLCVGKLLAGILKEMST